ncbi:MAG: Ni/Fe hydrogenase subunit alpha [Coriobacteriia bacterium]|nr:Ni/Fe hydrogenase subunit alpha [Coriobacteriia bacterium]
MPLLTVEHVARIEGHGTITVDVHDGEVRDISMDVVEPARFFESIVVGRRFDEAPLITSRICGICSPNHALTSIKAMEAALGVDVSERTRVMRKLLVYGSYLQNHATHLYLFAAPDFVGLPSVFPLVETHPEVVERALRIKKLGNDLTTLVGGRPVHPITAVVGGFTSEPDPHVLEGFAETLRELAEDLTETVGLFSTFEVPDFSTSGDMLALSSEDDYAIYEGDVVAVDGGWRKPVSAYRDFIREQVLTHSNAKHSMVDGRTFMVGALPRVNASSDSLTQQAKDALRNAGVSAVSRNTFHNNMCQAVELVDAAGRCAGYIDQLLEMGGSTAPVSVAVRAGEGAGATEAPRGTLYHSYRVDDDGIITAGDVITPTAQNLANLEADMRVFAPTVVGLPRDEFLLSLEQLVRAYDPCLSCAVH